MLEGSGTCQKCIGNSPHWGIGTNIKGDRATIQTGSVIKCQVFNVCHFIVRFEARPRKTSLLGKFLCLTAILFGLIIELGPFGFAFRYLGESSILGGEIQLSLHQRRFLSRGHGHCFSPEKCWFMLSPPKRPPIRRPVGDGVVAQRLSVALQRGDCTPHRACVALSGTASLPSDSIDSNGLVECGRQLPEYNGAIWNSHWVTMCTECCDDDVEPLLGSKYLKRFRALRYLRRLDLPGETISRKDFDEFTKSWPGPFIFKH